MENVLNKNESQLYLLSVYIVTFNNNVTGADPWSPWGSYRILLLACRLQLCTLPILTFWHQSFTFNSNKSLTWCNHFSVYYPDVCLLLNTFRAFSRPSSGAQWLPLQPLSSWRWAGKRPKRVELQTNVRIINWKTVASGWWFIWIVRWCTDLQTLNFTFKF
jgi:hypothetical protein